MPPVVLVDSVPGRTPPTDRGMSLLEILVTLLILAGSLLALAKFDGLITQAYSEAEQRSEATLLAQQCVEELRAFARNLSFPVTATMCGAAGLASGTHATEVAGASAAYARSWTVTSQLNPARTVMTVTVSWTDHSSAAQSVALTSITYPNNPLHSAEWIAPPLSPTP